MTAMMATMTGFEHTGPWTEAEWLALGETPNRVELIDGSLLVSPAPRSLHQKLSLKLAHALLEPAEAVGLEVYEAVNLRLRLNRVLIPDLVITLPVDDVLVFEAQQVALVGEITSPSNAGTDRVLKMHLYAEAGIPWYLLVEPKPLILHLFRLEGDKYSRYAESESGSVLSLTDPVRADLDVDALAAKGAQ